MSLMSDSLSSGLKKGKRVSLPDAPAKVNSDSDVYWKQIPYVGPFFRRMALASTGGIGDMLEGIGTMADSETIRNAGNYFSDMAREGEAELPPLRKPELSLDYMLDENGPIGATGMLAGSMVDMMLPAGATMKALSKIPAVMKGAGAVKNALEATKVGQKISPYVTTGAVLGATSAPWESVMEAGSASRELREGGADEQTVKDRTNDVFWQNMALLPFTNMAEMGLTGKYLDIVKDIYKPSIKTILGEKGVKQMMANAAKTVPEMAIGTAIQGLEEGLQGGINQNAIDPNSGASINPLNWTEQQWDDAKLGIAGMLLPSAVGVGSAGIRSGRTGEVDNDRLFSAMANQESNSYTAVNPDTGAYGRYQIMPSNWAAWAEEAGLPADAEKTPENQDIVAKHKFDEYVREYGPKGALVAWYAGPRTAEQYVKNPNSDAWDRPQDGYPSINGYINGVFSHYDGNDLELISVPNSTAPAENDTLDTSALNSSYNDYTTEHNRLVGEGLYDDTPEDYLRMISEANPRGTGSLALKHSDFAQSALDSGDEAKIKETARSLGYGSDKVIEAPTEEPTAEGTTTEEAKPVRTEPEAKIIDNSKKAKTPTKPLSKEEEKLLQEWYSTASAADGEIAMMDTMLIDAGQSGNWDGVRAVINRDKAKYNSNANRTDMVRPTAENGLAVNTPSASSPMNVPYSSGLSQKGAGSGVMTPVHQPPTPQSFVPDALNQLKDFIRQMLKDPQALANANGEAKLNKLNVEKALKGNDFNSLNRLASLLRRNKDSHAIAQKPVGTSAPNTTMPSTLNGKSPAMAQLDTEIAEDEKKREDKKKADEKARQDRKKQERAELREECAKLADYAEARGIRKDKNGNPINFTAIRKSLKNASTDKLNTIRRLLTEAIQSRAHTDRVVDEVINKIDEVKYAFRNAVESSDNGKMYLEGAIRAITNLADEPMRQYKDDVAVLSVLRNAVDRAVKEINDMAGNSPLQMKTVDHVPEPAPPPAPKKGKTTKKAEAKKKAGRTKTKEKAEVKSEEKVEDAESKVKEENEAKEESETKAETKTKTKAKAKEVEEVVDELEEDKYPDNAPTLENVTDITEAEFDELEDLGIRFKRKGKLVDGKPSWTLTFFSEDDKSRFVAAVYDEMEDEESAVVEDNDTPPMQEEVVEKEPEAEPKEEPAEIAEEPEEEAVDESEEEAEEEAVDEDAIADEEARKLEAKKASKKSAKAKVDDSFGGQIAGVIAGIKDKSISSVREVGKGFVVPFPADTSSKGKDKKANDDFRSIYNNLQMASGLAGFFSKEDFNSFLEKAKEESAKAGLTGEQAEYINDVVDKMKAWNEADLSTKFSASKDAVSKPRTSQEVQLELVKDEFPKATDIKQDGDTITFKLGGKEVTINFVDSIILTPSEEEAFERGYGKKPDGYTIKGKTAKVDGKDIITLLNNGDDTISHEAFHLACNLALSEKEYNTLMDEYGDEEKAAEAYRKQGGKTFDTSNPLGKIFQKIWDMANSLARTLDLGTWAFGAKSVMRAIETNDIYKLAPKDGKSQTAYVHPKYLAVLHSSASNIKKFSTSHVDNDEKGEGAQIHGWGIYFARTKRTAQFYFKYFKEKNKEEADLKAAWLMSALQIKINGKIVPSEYSIGNFSGEPSTTDYILSSALSNVDLAGTESFEQYILFAVKDSYQTEIKNIEEDIAKDKEEIEHCEAIIEAAKADYEKEHTDEDMYKIISEHYSDVINTFKSNIAHNKQKKQRLTSDLKAFENDHIEINITKPYVPLTTNATLLSVEVPELDVMIREGEPFDKQPLKVQKALRSAFKELLSNMNDTERGKELGFINHDKYFSILKNYKIDRATKNKMIEEALSFDEWFNYLCEHYHNGYSSFADNALRRRFGMTPKEVSSFLNKHGIEGISYEGGRDGECCVIFNDEAIKILDKTHDANDEEFFERHRKRLGVAKFSAESSNTTKLDKLPKVSYTKMNKTEKAIVNFGKSVGIPIHLVDAPQNAGNRGVFTHNGEIFINRKGNAPAKDIFFHEFTHWIRATQSDVYDMLRASVGDITQDRLDSYAKTIVGGEEMSNDELIEEIIADGMSNASSMEKMFATVSNMNDGIIGKVASFLRNMLDKFFNAFGLNPSRMLTEQKMPNHLNAEEMAKLNSVVNKALANLKNADGKKMFTVEKGKWKLNGKAISEHEVLSIADMRTSNEKETEEVRRKYEGTDQWMKAPNGETTTLTEQQWLLVRTPSFKKWFGDWENDPENASKVVDENGEPLVVYHGTDAEFDVFDRTKARANMDIQGNFFSPWEVDAGGYGGNVRAFFLNIKNPAPSSVSYKALNKYKGQNNAGVKARERLAELGYDGVNNDGEEYISFEPNQIKSATDNNGSFDPDDNNIKHSADKHSMAFPASASIKNAVDRALTRLAGTWGIKKGRDNVTVLTKKDIDPEKYDDISLIQYLFTSPQRLAKAFPKLGRIVQLAKKATDVQEQLRVRNNDVMTEVEDLLGYKKWGKNDKEYATRKSNLVNALYDGDVLQTEFTDAELKDKGLDDNTIKAYRKIRTLLKKVWDEVNDKRVGNVSKAINVSDAELMSKLAELNGDKFITVVNHTPNGRGGHIINYKEARSWVRKSMMSKDELDSLKKSDSVQILTESEIVNPDVTKDSAKDPYFKVTYKERIGDMGKINGYVPHLFHEYFVVAEKDGQHQIITSAQSINEAVDKANDYAEKNPSEQVLVRPKMFIPNEEDAEMSAVAMGDYDYAKVMKMFSDNHDMTVSEAKELTDGILKKNARHRFLGNAKHRKGASGYDENIMTALQHYLNQTSRYIAMEDFKVGAITHYEKVFGDFTSSDVTDKSISAKWAKQFIRDVNGNPTTTENMLNSIFFNLGFSREKANGRPALWLSHWLTYPMTITKLGLCNVSSAMINLTQLMNMAAAMDKNWAGKDGALKYIKVGMDEYYKTFSDKAKRDFLNNQLGLKSQIGIDVAGGYSNAENKTGGAIKDIANRSMSLFKTVDTLCRGVTLLGAYRSALDSGKSKAEAIRYAKEVNDKANFDYSVADAPSIFRNWGPISQVLFQFKKYPVKELELMCDVLSGGTGNYKDFRKLDNIKTFVERFSPYVLMSGVAGIPFISTVGGLCSLLASMLFGEDIDWDEEMKERVFDIGGADNPIVQAGLYGALAPLGVNVGTRVGVGDFMGVDTNRQSLIGNIAQFSTMLNSMEQFFTQLGYRNYTEMVKAISPSLGNLLQAIEGEARTTRGMLKYSYEDKPLERMIRAIGFTPTNESLENDLKKIEYRKSTREKNEKERAIDAFLDDESPENLKRLKELGVSSASVKTAREKRNRTIREINEENNSKKKPSVPKHEADLAYY